MIQTEKILHRGEGRLKVNFAYDRDLIRKIKHIDGARWSQTHKAWQWATSQRIAESAFAGCGFKAAFIDHSNE
jgi:hypothetical protein